MVFISLLAIYHSGSPFFLALTQSHTDENHSCHTLFSHHYQNHNRQSFARAMGGVNKSGDLGFRETIRNRGVGRHDGGGKWEL